MEAEERIRRMADEGIEAFVLDRHMSILEGSASAIPQRLMVLDEDAAAARHLLVEAGELNGDS